MVKEDLFAVVMIELRPEGLCKYRSPEAEVCLLCLGSRREFGVAIENIVAGSRVMTF